MSTELVAARMGAGQYAKPLEDACIRWRMETVNAKCHFLANCYVESDAFTRTQENLNYSVEGLLKTFSRARISEREAKLYGRSAAHPANQRKLAEILYKGFPGRGLIQLTWRDNYEDYSRAAHGDDRVVEDPEILARLPECVVSAGWFFYTHVPRDLQNGVDVAAVRRKINPAGLGIDEAEKQFERAHKLFAELIQ